jgi:chemotaxis protein CheC
MHVGLPGEIVLILDEKAAFKIIGMSYKLDEQTRNAGIFTEVGMSLLKEVGNIIIVSYVMAMGQILKRNILTSLPTFVSGSLDNILNAIFAQYSDKDYIFFIEAVFEEPEEKVRGGFCLAITQEAADDIKSVCKKILEDLEK